MHHDRWLWVDLGLVKAQDPAASDNWTLYIQASAPRVDHEGELVIPQAMQDGLAYFLENGKITWEHLSQQARYDPSLIIGQPLEGLVTADGRTLIKGQLFPYQPKAQDVWNILRSGGRLKSSIGGMVLSRDAHDPHIINKLLFTHLAVTSWPVNEATGVSLTPYAEFVKSLCTAKALGATTGTSAQPLVMEDLEGTRLGTTPDFAVKWEALTAIVARTMKVPLGIAKRIALQTLKERGETRRAYRSNPVA